MKKINTQLIMIDVDGTLVDSVPDLSYCINKMMLKIGRKTWEEDKIRNWVGNGVETLVRRSLAGKLEVNEDDDMFAKAYTIFIDLYAKNTSKRSSLYPGVLTGINYLIQQDYIIGCITNKAQQFTYPLLKDLNIFDKFKIIISGNTLSKKKPDPLPLLHAANHFKVPVKNCLMIGDSISDIYASRAAGFKIICMSYGYNHGKNIADFNPDLIIDSMVELKKIL